MKYWTKIGVLLLLRTSDESQEEKLGFYVRPQEKNLSFGWALFYEKGKPLQIPTSPHSFPFSITIIILNSS